MMTVKEFKIQLALGLISYKMKWILARTLSTPKEILDILYVSEEYDSNYLKHCVFANPNSRQFKSKNRPDGFGPEDGEHDET